MIKAQWVPQSRRGTDSRRTAMRNALNVAITAILVFALFDLLILFTGLAQIAYEGRTGYWNGFWRWQAEQMVQFLLR